MSSFATIFGLAKISGKKFRLGLSNNQYLYLSEMFPYFEEHAHEHAIEAMYCGSICKNINWQPVSNFFSNFQNPNDETIEEIAKGLKNNYSNGVAMNLGLYINYPIIYKRYLNELRSKVFVFKEEYTNNAQVSRYLRVSILK